MINQHLSLLFSAAFVASTASTFAQSVVFNYGPSTSYISADNQQYRDASGSALGGGPFSTQRLYSASAPITPEIGASYSGPNVYGGWSVTNVVNPNSVAFGFNFNTGNTRLRNDSTAVSATANDNLAFSFGAANQANTVTYTANILLLGAFSVANFDASSGISLTSSNVSMPTSPVVSVRPVIQVGSQFYVGDTVKTVSNGNSGTTTAFSGTELLGYNWSLYDPTAAIAYAVNSSATLSSISGVTTAGVLLSRNYVATATGADFRAINVASLSVTATPVPEPSAFAAIAGLGALGFVASRRRRRV